MLPNKDTSVDINRMKLVITEVAPFDRMGQPKDAINYVEVPLPSSYTDPLGKLKYIRLAVFLLVADSMPIKTHYTDHSVPSGLIFSFESSRGDSDLSTISTYDMQNYYNDIEYILANNYNLKNIIFSENSFTKDFFVDLKPYVKPYSIEEIRTILFVYSNPIKLEDNYLYTPFSIENYNYNYTVSIGAVRLYFCIGLNSDETKCITQIYWDENFSDKDFSYTELQSMLNSRIYQHMPWGMSPSWHENSQLKINNTGIYTGSELPMAFKYYYRGSYSCLESECSTQGNSYIRRYLLAILTGKIVYEYEKDTYDFLSCEMRHED